MNWVFLGILAILLVMFVVYVLRYKKQRFTDKELKWFQNYWRDVEAMAGKNPEQAIMKADKLLDSALKKCGFSGTFAEKLTAAKGIFRKKDDIWAAHRLRNKIAHEVDYHASERACHAALRAFETAFQDLGIPL